MEALPIVYDGVTKGNDLLKQAAAKAYTDMFKIVEVTKTQKGYQAGYFKGRPISYPDFRSMRSWAIPAKVVILYLVTTEGRVTEPRVVESTDHTLTDGILADMKSWRFTPARLQGRPVAHLAFFEQKFGGRVRDGNGVKGDGLGIMGYRDR
jgi:hypothetical protein